MNVSLSVKTKTAILIAVFLAVTIALIAMRQPVTHLSDHRYYPFTATLD